MTISFTLEKKFFKVAHYLLRFWIIFWMLKAVPFVLEMLQNLWAGGFWDNRIFQITYGLINLIVIAWGIRYLKYSPKNTYSENSWSPKEEISYWQALPKWLFVFYGVNTLFLLVFSFWASLQTWFQEWENIFWIYERPYFHLLLCGVALYEARRDYNVVFDGFWPKNGSNVTLIIKHRALLDGKIPDGLAHLKKGDLVKLVPSDVPEEQGTINVVNLRTPNGPVLMDRIFSYSFFRDLESTHVGYMYGEISQFNSANNIELTLSKDRRRSSAGHRDFAGLDELFEDAARLVVQTQQGSATLLQRKLKLGYNRAGRLIDQLEDAGILGPSKGHQVLIYSEEELKKILDEIYNGDIRTKRDMRKQSE